MGGIAMITNNFMNDEMNEELPSGWSEDMAQVARRLGINPMVVRPTRTRKGPVVLVEANGGLLITNTIGSKVRWA
tara:strand:- start:6882 stop:7106 length:225 start_codon:yes stop_codon:yes gene_type:complete